MLRCVLELPLPPSVLLHLLELLVRRSCAALIPRGYGAPAHLFTPPPISEGPAGLVAERVFQLALVERPQDQPRVADVDRFWRAALVLTLLGSTFTASLGVRCAATSAGGG
jgi:hypothetical protein